jgi:hypothetical protein
MEPQAICALRTYMMHTRSYVADTPRMPLPIANSLQAIAQ